MYPKNGPAIHRSIVTDGPKSHCVPINEPAPTPSNPLCGVERWSVKTLTDPDALRVDVTNVIPHDHYGVERLRNALLWSSRWPDVRRRVPRLRCLGYCPDYENEDDRDVHMALADPNDPTKTIVVEVVDPACATTSALLTTLSNAKGQYQALGPLVGRQMRVRGVGFTTSRTGKPAAPRAASSCIRSSAFRWRARPRSRPGPGAPNAAARSGSSPSMNKSGTRPIAPARMRPRFPGGRDR